ncbi:hypothetical protein F7725_007139 [Dissostichus mawsoni]|uniref:Uncharacterized protein n=1 Tax=Dissostichus mawsoni TaxID=36200 RepID=A0A7J5XVY2_DISMA|nr:hypothetical protein F7725_007139 [Dissostichus mawsoni]
MEVFQELDVLLMLDGRAQLHQLISEGVVNPRSARKSIRLPHPHDIEGFNAFELKSFGLYPDDAPLLFSIQRDRVKGRVVAELGEHSVGQLRGRVRAVEVATEERRTADPTARTTDFSMTV